MLFTAKDVKALREKTGCGMMDCKKALTESEGNMEKAVDFLREKGLAAATKKSGRVAAEGIAYSCLNETNDVGVIIEINSETDFVAKNEDFQSFVKTCALTVMNCDPKTVDELMDCKAVDSNMTVRELVQDKVLTIGENIKIRRFKRLEGILSSYIHANGKISVLVKFSADSDVKTNDRFKTFSKDIAMQIAAINPMYLNKEQVPEDVIEHEKKIISERAVNQGKDDLEKAVMRGLKEFYKENCLLDQPFVKNSRMSVEKYISEISRKLNSQVQIDEFVRFEKGEGIEKREDNFAEEVASMIK